MADIFKYIVAQNPNDPTKVLIPYNELLSEQVLVNIFYRRYSSLNTHLENGHLGDIHPEDVHLEETHLEDINLYECII